MYSNFNYYPQQQQAAQAQPIQQPMATSYMRPQVQSGLRGRPVSSLEEARASSIDFDGTVFYFPDLANKRIYTKQINLDGTATLNMYELKDVPTEPAPSAMNNYVTREEFEAAIGQLKNALIPVKPPEEVTKPQVCPEILQF